MNIDDALQIVIARTKHERYRWLCSDDNPDEVGREHYRALVISQANEKALEYPSLFQQATNVAKAIGSVVASAVHGEPITVSQEEQDRRLVICHACEFWDSAQARCAKCGCFGAWKTWLASQKCPLDPPKW